MDVNSKENMAKEHKISVAPGKYCKVRVFNYQDMYQVQEPAYLRRKPLGMNVLSKDEGVTLLKSDQIGLLGQQNNLIDVSDQSQINITNSYKEGFILVNTGDQEAII